MDWKQFQERQGGVLVIGHGTRRPDGVHQLVQLADRMRALLTNVPLVPCFLELAEPTIDDGLAALANLGVRHVFVIPILLFEAGHARDDIPSAVTKAAVGCAMRVVGQSSPLGTHESALRLSEKRFLEALRCSNRDGCLRAGGCEVRATCFQNQLAKESPRVSASDLPTIGLAMVGRGTSDTSALAAMRKFTELRVARFSGELAWSHVGFFAGGEPRVDALLAEAANAAVDTVVVQPHLLFEGELMEQLRAKVRALMDSSESPRWLIPMPLGDDTALAQTFLELAAERLGELSMEVD